MTVAELIEMILGERIAAILSQTSSEKDVLEKGEMVLNELPEEQGAGNQRLFRSFHRAGRQKQ